MANHRVYSFFLPIPKDKSKFSQCGTVFPPPGTLLVMMIVVTSMTDGCWWMLFTATTSSRYHLDINNLTWINILWKKSCSSFFLDGLAHFFTPIPFTVFQSYHDLPTWVQDFFYPQYQVKAELHVTQLSRDGSPFGWLSIPRQVTIIPW